MAGREGLRRSGGVWSVMFSGPLQRKAELASGACSTLIERLRMRARELLPAGTRSGERLQLGPKMAGR